MKKILWIDVETTDSDTKRGGGIHQISYILEVGGKVVCEREFKMHPFKNDLINAKSLAVCKLTYDDILKYPHPTEAFKQLVNDIAPYKKVVLGGFNNSIFDNPYFQSWWFKCTNDLGRREINLIDYIHFDALDVRVLAVNHFLEQRDEIKSFKLMDVARLVGIEVDEEKLHDAKYDIELTRDIYYRITNAQAK